ncbi:MAG TPA: hypothetical protein VHW09_18340 [Bryobacteraceae bacterium]|jgi:hypothetical protein|nr:hypothetical protein [Bryobacteraceae bacterium]
MANYLKRWEDLKKAFESTTNQQRPKEVKKKIILGTVQQASGLTPVLKTVDAALEKKQRAPLEQALNKLFQVRGTYATFLMGEQKKFLNDPDDPEMVVWIAYKDLIFGIQKIEEDASKDAKALQEAKGGETGITWLSLEGDIKGTVQAAKKLFAPFAAQEKKNKLLCKADGAVKAAETYTKAAARTQAADARKALELFKKEAKEGADDLAKVLNAEKDPAYKKAIQSFHDAMKAISTLARIDAQIKNLQDMEKA